MFYQCRKCYLSLNTFHAYTFFFQFHIIFQHFTLEWQKVSSDVTNVLSKMKALFLNHIHFLVRWEGVHDRFSASFHCFWLHDNVTVAADLPATYSQCQISHCTPSYRYFIKLRFGGYRGYTLPYSRNQFKMISSQATVNDHLQASTSGHVFRNAPLDTLVVTSSYLNVCWSSLVSLLWPLMSTMHFV